MYNHKEIENKWQTYWEKNKTFKIENDFSKPKYYTLDMFPYPSGAGLHVGHPEWFTANDIIARYKTANWFNVLHPMGWDAFWLPAENYALQTGTHPWITTDENINNFRRQIKALGFSYDWDREVDTTDPKYYKWTQWIFLKLFENGLAYEQDLPINYCPSCETGLANEEVLNDFTCERCGTKVEKRKIRQWVLAITKYADRLLDDVDKLDWPEGIKDMQRNWIWKSEGCEFEMKKAVGTGPKMHSEDKMGPVPSIGVYTTRIDTVFGMTYAVLAPDHESVNDFITPEQKDACLKYIDNASKKSDQDRTQDDKEKTWGFTGSYVINPFNWKEVPLWIADYVLWNYWTWAVMAVPAHDIRDFEFAKKYDLEIIESIISKSWESSINEKAYTEYWILIDSWDFSWLTTEEAKI
jgi:leucyl-tRNA synthetase